MNRDEMFDCEVRRVANWHPFYDVNYSTLQRYRDCPLQRLPISFAGVFKMKTQQGGVGAGVAQKCEQLATAEYKTSSFSQRQEYPGVFRVMEDKFVGKRHEVGSAFGFGEPNQIHMNSRSRWSIQ